ncbi:hypothetical protein SXANM310S_06356 [Streptomyces xanthochromogenes]
MPEVIRPGDPHESGTDHAGVPAFLDTAEQQGVSPELLVPYFALMRRRLAEGSPEEDLAGVVDLLVRPRPAGPTTA